MAAPKVEPKIYTAIVLDFETGGLTCTDSACTQIAMQAVRLDTWEVLDRYAQYIAPYSKQAMGGAPMRKLLKTKNELAQPAEPMKYEPRALEYSAVTMETLRRDGIDLKQVATDLIEFVKRNTLSKGAQCKPILIGQNITFDVGFLTQMMNYAGLLKEYEKVFFGTKDFYGNFQPHYIDTIDLGRMTFAADRSVNSYKLELICERLGIELNDAHDADSDVTATLNIAMVCSNRMRNNVGGNSAIHTGEKRRTHFKF